MGGKKEIHFTTLELEIIWLALDYVGMVEDIWSGDGDGKLQRARVRAMRKIGEYDYDKSRTPAKEGT
jgi:hypothetical protein